LSIPPIRRVWDIPGLWGSPGLPRRRLWAPCALCQRRMRLSQDQHALVRRFVRSGRHESAESVRSVTATLGPGAQAINRWLPQLSTPAARGAAARAAGAQVWLKQPLVSLADINMRHDVVEALVSDPELRERLHDSHLRGAPAAAARAGEPGAPTVYPDAVCFGWSHQKKAALPAAVSRRARPARVALRTTAAAPQRSAAGGVWPPRAPRTSLPPR